MVTYISRTEQEILSGESHNRLTLVFTTFKSAHFLHSHLLQLRHFIYAMQICWDINLHIFPAIC
jgi:hypothetical protein